MHYEDERWVKLYTRDTVTWKRLAWQARCVLALLLRKVDGAGVVEIVDDHEDDLAVVLELPREVVAVGLNGDERGLGLVRTGVVVLRDGAVVLPRYLDAQETRQSDRVRQRASRERSRSKALGEHHDVTSGHHASPAVTTRHQPTESVTSGHHASPDVTIRREEKRGEERESGAAPLDALARSPSAVQIEQALAGEAYQPCDRRRLADALDGERIAKGARTEWVIEAVGECARDIQAGKHGKDPPAATRAGLAMSYARRAKAPASNGEHPSKFSGPPKARIEMHEGAIPPPRSVKS